MEKFEIPLGFSREDIKVRERIIQKFYSCWIAANPDRKVWNESLQDFIHVKYLSINETYNKAARTPASTLAVFRLTEVLQKAQVIREDRPKANNRNQKGFERMLIMHFDNIKLTVGVQRSCGDKVQYCITAIEQ